MGRYSLPKRQLIIGLFIFICLITLLHLKFNGLGKVLPSNSSSSSSLISYPSSNEVDEKILNVYQHQISERQKYLQKVPETKDYSILYNVLVPEVLCRDLVRIGFIVDGGKWICNPSKVLTLPNCVVYSLGIKDDPSFEESFQNLTQKKCLIRSMDKDDQNVTTMKRIASAGGTFFKAFIAGKTIKATNHYTFKDVMAEFGDKRVDILKIDIEGAEFDILDELVSVPICQILIEVHGKSAKHTLQFLQKLSQHGFYLFSYEINGESLLFSEYSFIHLHCFKDYGIKTIYGKYLS